MKIVFHGVRGSIPAPGPATARFGGNTACVHLRLDGGEHVVLDAGTGIRRLGQQLLHEEGPILLLISHGHWDHIMGFPFFAPIYQERRFIRIFSGNHHSGELGPVLANMDGASFPVRAADLPSRIERLRLAEVEAISSVLSADVRTLALNHPGSGCAFRIEEGGIRVVYATDNELDPPGPPATSFAQWVEFCHGADLLIHDAQYVASDFPAKRGWGHSATFQAQQLAAAAEVRLLALFHHDPDRSDRQLEQIERECQEWLRHRGSPCTCVCAYEGMELELKP